MTRQHFTKILLSLSALLVFLLPWQTRYIYNPVKLNGSFWEYGTQSLYATELLLWLVILIFAVDRFRQKSFWSAFKLPDLKRAWLYWVVVAGVVLYFCFQIFHNPHPEISEAVIFHIIECACFLAVLAQLEGDKKIVLIALWLAGVGQALLGLFQFAVQQVYPNKWLGLAYQSPFLPGSGVIDTPLGHILRAYGSLGGPNPLGIFLAVIYILGLILYLQSTARWQPWLTLGQGIIVGGLIVSFSRAGWLAAVVGAITLVVMLYKNKDRSTLQSVIHQFIVAAVLGLVCFFWLHLAFTTRLDPTARLEQYSIKDRESQYTTALTIAPQKWLTGVGPGLYTYFLFENNPHLPGWQYQPIHDAYVLVFAEMGIIGFAFFATIFYCMVKRIWQTNPLYLAVIITLLVASFFEHFMWSLYVGQLFWWTVFALGLVAEPTNRNNLLEIK